ncbi:MAG TPA: hypothetical protein VHO06_17165 [Polyangia bacterium]|nr:hypothetical protein [Polyangia bacterium]
MTTVAEVDRQVKSDDAVAARLWPKLGPKVRTAYLHDRDAWIAIRRDVDTGKQPSSDTLEAQHKAFAGWARAFHAASKARKRPATAVVPVAAAAAATTVAPLPSAPAPAIAVKKAAMGGAGGAVAGGLVLAGLIALAARRKRA